jgi:glucosamine 6-phosphate synthetase-like amidotransferase/phosphosugar isomerase protein
MCGLFGTVRPQQYPQQMRTIAATALLDLGYLAEERGVDSAGIATLHRRTLSRLAHPDPAVREQITGRWRIRTALGAFSTHLPDSHQLRSNLASARVVLGHTRWATQGATTLDNASPLNAGDIIGTHNGDVTAPTRNGSTDSAWLFKQLNNTTTSSATASVLTSLRGRAALAWVRRPRTDLVFLARTALSPLATATDRAGALWWASNPQWLRELDGWHDLVLTSPVPMMEGTLIVLRSDRDEVTLSAYRRFAATSRPLDERLAHSAAWRGFTITDRRYELDHQNHHVQSAHRHRVDARSERPG